MTASRPLAPQPDQETRDRLLVAAAGLFAQYGFRAVTVRDICQAASANVAAVNYYFGDKLGLYREVLQSAIDSMRATSDAARRAGEDQPPAERLRRYVRIYLRHVMLDPGITVTHKLMTRELSDPTPALDDLIDQGIRPRVEYLSTIVAERLVLAKSDPRVMRAAASILAQTIFYLPNPVSTRLLLKPKVMTVNEVDALADHITTFSLGGLDAIRKA